MDLDGVGVIVLVAMSLVPMAMSLVFMGVQVPGAGVRTARRDLFDQWRGDFLCGFSVYFCRSGPAASAFKTHTFIPP
jgi:hypothetical protein